MKFYDPICIDGTTYYSPCHAGCETDSLEGICHCVSKEISVLAKVGVENRIKFTRTLLITITKSENCVFIHKA
jgi:hypothetical protein